MLFNLTVWLIALFGGLAAVEWTSLQIHENTAAVKGQLTLQTVNTTSHIFSLNGQWSFYPNQLLSPKQLAENKGKVQHYVDVPGVFGQGYGTYELTVRLTGEQRSTIDALSIPSISSAYRFWVNGTEVHDAGTIGRSRDEMIANDAPTIVSLGNNKPSQPLHLVVEVSNFVQQKGGIGEEILLGNLQSLMRYEMLQLIVEMFIVGGLITMALYFVSLYLSDSRNRFPFYFSLLCLDIAIQALVLHSATFSMLLSHLNWAVESKMQYLSVSLGEIALLLAADTLYPRDAMRKFSRALTAIGAMFSGLFAFTPTWIFTYTLSELSLFTFVVLAYILVVFLKGVQNRRPYALLNLASLSFIIASSINDILYYTNRIHTGDVVSIGQFVFVLIQTVAYSLRYSDTAWNLEVTAQEVARTNDNLENTIHERTIELQTALEELRQSNARLNYLSMRDSLTGIPNRRYFETVVREKWEILNRSHTYLTVLFIDIDHFKQYNDANGHMQGDQCLIEVATCLENRCGHFEEALIARFGGEEFVAIVPHKEESEGVWVGEMLREEILSMQISHVNSELSPFVTASIGGVTVHTDTGIAIEELLEQADEALYHAKDNGRNQTYVRSAALKLDN